MSWSAGSAAVQPTLENRGRHVCFAGSQARARRAPLETRAAQRRRECAAVAGDVQSAGGAWP